MGWVRRYILLIVVLTLVYHSNLRPVASGDSLPASLIPFSLLLDGTITLDRFGPWMSEHVHYSSQVVVKRGDHWYSVFPIAGPVLSTPLYLPVAFVPWIRRQPPETLIAFARIVEKGMAVALAIAAAIALQRLLRRFTSDRAAWILTLVFALSTGNWSTSSQALWQHTYGQLALIGCFYSIDRWSASGAQGRWFWIAGIFAACALAIRPTNVAILPALAVGLWLSHARVWHYVRVFVPAAIAAALTAFYNFTVFQNPTGAYVVDVNRHLLDGFLGVLFSPGRGLLIYTPIAIFALWAFVPGASESRARHRPILAAASVFSLAHIVIVGAWPIWWGGYCWGPRYMTELLPPVMILIAIGLPALGSRGFKSAFAAAAVYGFLIQALGVYCYPKGQWDHLPVNVNLDRGRLWNWVDNPVVRTARGGFAWEPYEIVNVAVRQGWPAARKRLQQLGIGTY